MPPEVSHGSLGTVRSKLVKIGARVVRQARRIIFQMVEVAVSQRLRGRILDRSTAPVPVPSG